MLRRILDSVASLSDPPAGRVRRPNSHRKSASALAVAAWMLPAAACLAAGPDGPAGKDPLVTFRLENATIGEALEQIFKQAGLKYRLDRNATEVAKQTRVTTVMDRVPFSMALRAVIRSQESSNVMLQQARIEKGVYVFTAGAPAAGAHTAVRLPEGHDRSGHIDRDVTLNLANLELADALRILFGEAKANYAFPHAAAVGGKVSIRFDKAPFEEALKKLLAFAGPEKALRFDVWDGVYMIGPSQYPLSAAGGAETRVTLQMRDADVRYALKAVFRTANANYTLDQNVKGRVTVDVRGAKLADAMRAVLDAAKPAAGYFAQFVDGVWRITPASR